MKSIVTAVLLSAAFISSIIFFIQNQHYYTRPFDPDFFASLYSKSQYVLGPASKGGIGDDGLYAFAGYYYFSQKGDVSSVNFEHPPFGKYLIGLSIFLFHNENVINIIYFFFLLLITYKSAFIILRDKLLASVAVFLVSVGPLLRDHTLRSLLDLPFSLFFTTGIYFFLLSFKKVKYIYISLLFFSFAFSTKFFPALLIILFFLLCILIKYAKAHIKHFIFSLLLIPTVYIISNISFFIYHLSLVEFIKHKIWMIKWFSGSPFVVGNILRNMFTGYYIGPTGNLEGNDYWTIIEPIVITLASFPFLVLKKKKNNISLVIVYGISSLFLLYIFFLTLGLQKFLMPIYPIMVILALESSRRFYSIMYSWRLKILRS